MGERAVRRILGELDEWPVGAVSASVTMVGESPGWVVRHGDPGRVYELASVTKLLSAYAVLVAVEEGAFDLDDAAGPDGSTVRHLLAHASGVAFADRTPVAAPGVRRVYSSAGYEILADLVEVETGIPFPEYLREAVLAPLGMTSTVLHGSAGHGARGSLADLTAFAGELLDPRILHPATLREAGETQFPGLRGIVPGYGMQRPCDWGLGFEIRDGKMPHWMGEGQSPRAFGHFGQAGTFLWVDPDLRAAVVVLTDRPFGDWAKPLWAPFNDRLATALRARVRAEDALGG